MKGVSRVSGETTVFAYAILWIVTFEGFTEGCALASVFGGEFQNECSAFTCSASVKLDGGCGAHKSRAALQNGASLD